jgi:hypothetical protein
MKTFIYKEVAHHNRRYNNRELTIYRLKNNKIEYVGTTSYTTGSTRGAIHEAFNYLMNSGYIPKKYYNSSKSSWMGAGYFFGEVRKNYDIVEV